MTPFDLDWDEGPVAPPGGTFKLREYQREWVAATNKARAEGFSRLLLDAVGGSGKTTYAGALALEAWNLHKCPTLILENRQQLVEQTAKRFRDETGLEVDIEMGTHRASPYAAVVVASVASYGRVSRLTGFADGHFEYVFADEAHNSTADLFLRIMRYHHYGAASLAEGWEAPKDGTYVPKACVIGITATPDSHGKRNLGNFYQKFVARYSYLQAIEDGWLVGIKEVNIPIKIDTRKFRRKASGHGMDFSAEDEAQAIIPIIEELAAQTVTLAANRKTMCYLPSKECVILMCAALNARGLKSVAVLGDSLDKTEDTATFYNHGPGICMVLCAMYVEGADFPSCDTVAWFRATESPAFYKQGIYRCSRALPGLVNDAMGADGRRAAIAASAKPWSLVISPFFVSDKIDIMSVQDLFVDQSIRGSSKKTPDFTKPAEIRDWVAALEKAADKHSHKHPRTINPVSFALDVGDKALAHYVPDSAMAANKPSKEELDFIWNISKGAIDTSAIKNSGEAQLMITRLIERDRLGLAKPAVVQLLLQLGMNKEQAVLLKAGQAGAICGNMLARKRAEEAARRSA